MSPRTRSTAWCWAPGWSWSTSISSATPSSSRSDADRAAHRAFVDLHCHTSWSPDSLSRPEDVARVAAETAAAVHEQGGLVGLAHPFDRFRGSFLAGRGGRDGLDAFAPLVDYVETFNARVPLRGGNDRAAAWAALHGLPGGAVSG